MLATGRPISKTLIKNNSNDLGENEEKKEPIDVELTEHNTGPEMIKMQLTLNYRCTR